VPTEEEEEERHKKVINFMFNLFDTGLYSDLELSFHDEMTQRPVCTFKVHNIILYTSGSQFFRNIIDKRFKGSKDVVILHFNFEYYTEEMLRCVFQFLYHAQSKNITLLPKSTVDFIHAHVLYFHQLSLYFSFVELEEYCLRKIYQEMSPDLFEKLSFYCLTQENDYKYNIMGDKLVLYNRMVQWHQYCIEKPNLPDSQEGKDHQGFLVHHNEKINHFEQLVCLPKKYISPHNHHIEYYQSHCSTCLHTNKNIFFDRYKVYLGGIRSVDNRKTCYFNLMRPQDRYNHFELYITHNQSTQEESSTNQDSMSIESSSSSSHSYEESLSVPMHTKLTLFSKKLHLDSIEATKSLGDLTHVLAFNLHDEQDCYMARCSTCHRHKPVYIMHISIDIVK
jgi:hypothetical protein